MGAKAFGFGAGMSNPRVLAAHESRYPSTLIRKSISIFEVAFVSRRRFRISTLGGVCMRIQFGVFAVSLSLLAGSVPLLAHHSFAAEYDSNKPVKISGVVTKVEWMNPHARFYVDVKGADGKVTNWNFELGAIPVLLKQGWTKNSLKAGDQVTVEGSAAKDNSSSANARSVTLPDGRRVFGGSSAPNSGQDQ
jgi:Family of unknown function (DUF6152)